ncbi:hypothetical protein Ae201684P_022217 [Aphanomyces euteiches]|nr:hypothetical protein Ae201684P_022217 [Aphanomyces euteiches]
MACQAEFFHVDCGKSANLFSGMYFRRYTNYHCNVLRCFPHCCPHKDKRCGTSISIRLPATLIDPTRLQAFATFQPSSTRQIQQGESLPVTMFASRRSSTNLRGKWLLGRPDSSSRLPCFHFNADKTEGWHYDWKGGASVMQRLEKHHLCVRSSFHFEFSTMQCRYKVVASASSPPFLLGSYRRALFPPGKSTATPILEKPEVHSHAEVNSSSAAMLYDMRRFCQTLTISDFPSDWRQFEQSLFRELQERFKLTINHSELVQFKGKDELFVGDFQGTRKVSCESEICFMVLF